MNDNDNIPAIKLMNKVMLILYSLVANLLLAISYKQASISISPKMLETVEILTSSECQKVKYIKPDS